MVALAPVDPQWIRSPVDLLAIEQGCYFDEADGKRYCDFIESCCCLWEGKWAGEPLQLMPWERDWLMRLFGWKKADGLRRYRSSYLEVGKKNGKSPLLAAVVIAVTLLDDEGGPKAYLNASDREQARIIFETVSAMIEQSPELGEVFEVIDSRNRIVCKENRGVIIANSATVNTKDGRNASLVVFDELHQQRDRRLWSVFLYAGASRDQFLRLAITTAGDSEEGVWYQQRVYSEQVNAGKDFMPDTTHLGVVYRCLPTDDLDSPEVWRKANPSLGYTIDPAIFKLEWEQAQADPLQRNDFLRYRFNIIARASAKYFDMDRWAKCACNATDPNRKLTTADLLGLPVYMGIDLGSISDFTALVVLAGSEATRFKMLTRFWVPEACLDQLQRETKKPYKVWAEQGHLITTPGERTDYEFLRREIKELARLLNVVRIFGDAHNATEICGKLIEQDGLPLEFLPQGFISLNDPTKQFKRLIDVAWIEHDANPVMGWCVSNAVADQDAQENVKLNKRLSRLKIDGAAAGVNATAAAIAGDPGESVYETEPLFLL